MATRLIIDGYNLLNATGIVGPQALPPTLERSRHGLLNFLATRLDQSSRESTTIVFDAMNAPPGLPHHFTHHDITVLFAPRSEDADTLIERLIQSNTAPRQLTVVSSDHRIQRAARRRRATPVDSDRWYANVERLQHLGGPDGTASDVKPRTPLSKDEVNRWLDEFGELESTDNHNEEIDPGVTNSKNHKKDKSTHDSDDWDGFPPGYLDDLPNLDL